MLHGRLPNIILTDVSTDVNTLFQSGGATCKDNIYVQTFLTRCSKQKLYLSPPVLNAASNRTIQSL